MIPFGLPELVLLLLLVGLVWLSVYAAKDMNKRGRSGWLYGLLILFTWPVGLTVWLILRSQSAPAEETSVKQSG